MTPQVIREQNPSREGLYWCPEVKETPLGHECEICGGGGVAGGTLARG